MKKFIPFLIGGILAISTFGCQPQEAAQTTPEEGSETTTQPAAKEASDTTADTPTDTAATDTTTDPAATDTTTDPAATDTAADPAATDTATDPAAADTAVDPAATDTATDPTAADGDITTAANKALKDKLPNNKLEVKEEAGVVTVSGTVSSDEELGQIEPTVKGVEGVTEVKVDDVKVEAAPGQ